MKKCYMFNVGEGDRSWLPLCLRETNTNNYYYLFIINYYYLKIFGMYGDEFL